MKNKRFIYILFVLTFAILLGISAQPILAAGNFASDGSIEIVNRTNIFDGKGMTIDRVQYLSYSTEDLNNANWKLMCGAPLVVGDNCFIKLPPGKYILRTLTGGETIQVFTDVQVSAGYTTRISAETIYEAKLITIINESRYDIEHIYGQEGHYVSDPVSLAEKPLLTGRITPGSWQRVYINGAFAVHHILVRDEKDGRWFYDVPSGGEIVWQGSGGYVVDESIHLDFYGNPPAAVYAELYRGDFRELAWGQLSNGYFRAILPNQEDYAQWNILIVDAYCGGLNISYAYCTVPLSEISPSSPFVMDPCNYDYPCNGSPGGAFPDSFSP